MPILMQNSLITALKLKMASFSRSAVKAVVMRPLFRESQEKQLQNYVKTYSFFVIFRFFASAQKGKVKHKTIANLAGCSEDEIKAIKLALKHKNNLSALGSISEIQTVLGKRIGAVWALYAIADRLGIQKALGTGREGKLALIQVLARIIDQGSRLSAVRFAQSHSVCEVVGIDQLNENDLYENLGWLADQQEKIEKQLFSTQGLVLKQR